MKNVMMIDGQRAVIEYDPDIEMFRGEFVGLNGSADFYARNITGLKQEGKASLKVFLQMCAEEGVEPFKRHSGKFVLRLDPGIHQAATAASKASGLSLNQWVAKLIQERAAV
ncbi:MAG: type II toxin-antitoxin system HicB family antitoxin [Nitrosomonadales bacterium]|nr:type II toxin-antitoxin system HicB family antitoxin [Nitrosomonadales bacterium]